WGGSASARGAKSLPERPQLGVYRRVGRVPVVEDRDAHRVPDDPGGDVTRCSDRDVDHGGEASFTLQQHPDASRGPKPALSGNFWKALPRQSGSGEVPPSRPLGFGPWPPRLPIR